MKTIVAQSIRKASGCSKTTPINRLHALNAEIHLNYRTASLAKRELFKTIAYSPIHKNNQKRIEPEKRKVEGMEWKKNYTQKTNK